MPTYTNAIPTQPRGPALPIRRAPASGHLAAIITSDDLIGTNTHYYKGRTMPCEAPECDACSHGVPYRWHSYCAAWEPKTALHFIFETTATAAEAFIEYRDHHKTLRGCFFSAKRWQQRPNGRILIQTKPADLTEYRLPTGPDLTRCLAILWSLPEDNLGAPS